MNEVERLDIGGLIITELGTFRILKNGSHFCLNNVEKGGCIGHAAWTMGLLQNYFAKEAVVYDLKYRTMGIYNF